MFPIVFSAEPQDYHGRVSTDLVASYSIMKMEKESTVDIYLGKFHHDLTATEPWNHGECIGKSSPNGPTIQVGEIL
jgi:hypothetical protein